MDIVIVIIVCGLVLYYLYGNPTKRKYEKGLEALKSNNLDIAEKYFKEISDKLDEAKKELDTITFKRGEIAEREGKLDKAHEYYSSIQKKNPRANEKVIEINYHWGIEAKSKGDIETAYSYFTKIAANSNKAFLEASIIDFKRGVAAELSKNYSSAKEFYNKSSSYKEDNKIHYGSICRKNICDIKNDFLPPKKEITAITKSPVDEKFKNDFIYRYAIKLIKKQNFSNASEIISSNLDLSINEVDKLLTAIENYKKSQVRSIAQEINSLLSSKESNATSIEAIYEKIKVSEEVIDEFPEHANKISEVKKNLFGKLIHQYLNEDQFEKCLDLILSYPTFYEVTELMKNAAICCIKISLSQGINETNYKKIIPAWLTAIHNDDLFIQSLESTTWDDEYTFTIKNAIGKYGSFIYKRDWGNINREEPTENNIDIGNSQRELLNLFENSLNSIPNESLQNKIHSFYEEEKKAISDLIAYLGYDTLHATPTFAKEYKVDKEILRFLNKRYDDKGKDKLLEIGAKYFTLEFGKKGTNVVLQGSTVIEKFASAQCYANWAIDEIKGKRVHSEPKVYRDIISQFDFVKNDFENKAYIILQKYIQSDSPSESIIELLERVHLIIPTSEKLSFLFSDYTTNYCIDKINEKEISEIKALELLTKAINICPEHHRTAKNLAVFIGMNLTKDNFLRKVKELIPSYRIESDSLYNSFNEELAPMKKELTALLRQSNINHSKVREVILTIDQLIEAVEQTDNYENDDLPF